MKNLTWCLGQLRQGTIVHEFVFLLTRGASGYSSLLGGVVLKQAICVQLRNATRQVYVRVHIPLSTAQLLRASLCSREEN